MLTDKEIDQKLLQHGLPGYGTREEKLERLVRNGLHVVDMAPGKITETFEGQREVNKAKALEVEAIAANPKEPVVFEPRKPGRPKKGK